MNTYLVAVYSKNGQCRELEVEAHSAEEVEQHAWCSLSEREQWELESMQVLSPQEADSAATANPGQVAENTLP